MTVVTRAIKAKTYPYVIGANSNIWMHSPNTVCQKSIKKMEQKNPEKFNEPFKITPPKSSRHFANEFVRGMRIGTMKILTFRALHQAAMKVMTKIKYLILNNPTKLTNNNNKQAMKVMTKIQYLILNNPTKLTNNLFSYTPFPEYPRGHLNRKIMSNYPLTK